MVTSISILFVEDDLRLALLTAEYLEAHGHHVTRAGTAKDALAEAARGHFDVVVLDIMLPDQTGFDVCRALRTRSAIPIIMLTARDEEVDRVMGLQLGADDYVVKPFSSRELLARVEAVVRRARGQVGPAPSLVKLGDFELDARSFVARYRGHEVPLTAYEFTLLRILVENAGQVLSREQLMAQAGRDAEDAFDRSIDTHISRLRQKLGAEARGRLKTIRSVGYLFTVDDS